MKKFSFKIFEQGNNKLLAIVDVSILGKSFEKDGLELDISKEFYHEGLCTQEEVMEKIKEATIINAMGEDIVTLLVESGIVEKQNVLRPCGIPHAQVVRM